MTQTIDSIEYLDVDEAAALLSVKKATLYAYVSRGLLRSFRQGVGRKRLYRRADKARVTVQENCGPMCIQGERVKYRLVDGHWRRYGTGAGWIS